MRSADPSSRWSVLCKLGPRKVWKQLEFYSGKPKDHLFLRTSILFSAPYNRPIDVASQHLIKSDLDSAVPLFLAYVVRREECRFPRTSSSEIDRRRSQPGCHMGQLNTSSIELFQIQPQIASRAMLSRTRCSSTIEGGDCTTTRQGWRFMKRSDLERHLRNHGCEQEREGANHSVWLNPSSEARSSVPRHHGRDLKRGTVRKICQELGVPVPRGF